MPKSAKDRLPKNPALVKLRKEVAKAPTQPGVYKWKDEEGVVLYVGKAKNLRNRLRSYVSAQGGHMGPWKLSFLAKIKNFEVTVTGTELEALILETHIIKELKPKFNVLMKDDKNYVYARITVAEPYPRIEMVRKVDPKDSAKYFGPMLSGGELAGALTALRTLFPFRTCKMDIQPTAEVNSSHTSTHTTIHSSLLTQPQSDTTRIPIEVVCTHKDRPTPCLDHHIGACGAPCIGLIKPEQYRHDVIDGVMRFLKGDYESVRSLLKVKMQQAASERKFELAAKLRDHQGMIDRLDGRSQIVSDTSKEDTDVVAIAIQSGRAYICLLRRRNGRIIGDESHTLAGFAEDTVETLTEFLAQYYSDVPEIPPQILVSEELPDAALLEALFAEKRGTKVKLIVPERGRKSALLQMAEKNAREKAKLSELKWEAEERNRTGALTQLKELLHLETEPTRIECYDISHLGGTETVASMTVAINGALQSKHYRSFNVRSLKSGDVDDYRSLEEALTRRLRRLKDDVPEEEKRWNAKGVTFAKATKKDQEFITQTVAGNPGDIGDEAVDYHQFWVVRTEAEIIAFARFFPYPGSIVTIRSLWVKQEKRGDKLGQFLLRRMLKTIKKGKVYLHCKEALQEYYASVGFRYVIKPPKPLQEKMETFHAAHPEAEPTGVLLWEAVQNKVDPSFSVRPDLLVIDGGKGQLSTVKKVLDTFELNIPVVGLAKREEEIFIPDQSFPITFPKDSPGKFLLMRLRDEAHRFANYKREGRGLAEAKRSILDDVGGIGDETKKKLMEQYKTISGIKAASDEALLEIVSLSQLEALRKTI